MESKKFKSSGVEMIKDPLEYVRHNVNASEIQPKEDPTDIGWVLDAVERDEARIEDEFQGVNLFKTNISFKPPKGYHVEIVPHPDLYRSGYMLLGPIVINPRDENPIMLPLFKFRQTDDLQLPYSVGLVVLRESEYATEHIPPQARVEKPKFADGSSKREKVPSMPPMKGGRTSTKKSVMY